MAAVRGSGARALQGLGLLLLAAVTVALCYLALTRETAEEALIGRFASWGLIEDGPEQAPAVIESGWAG